MIIPVKCFTCGNVLGDKYLYYVKTVSQIKQDENIDKNNIQYLTNDNMQKSIEGRVLDNLKLTKQCCRRHMLTHVDIFS
uniref:DNA-directed RNA polymerase RPB10 homolog n=1 Tax=Florenciella sp. virus SA2 TaxID=3240092 RepID=A0AB39JEY9_9VIRU|tara:strand:+ start:7446 stop:7682 length:237 start_codon:yes stop_codon:yes gene_type:complete